MPEYKEKIPYFIEENKLLNLIFQLSDGANVPFATICNLK